MSEAQLVWAFAAAMASSMAAVWLTWYLADLRARRRVPSALAVAPAWRLRADLRWSGLLMLAAGIAIPGLLPMAGASSDLADGNWLWGIVFGLMAGMLACAGWMLWRHTIRLDATGLLANDDDGLLPTHIDWGSVRRIRYDLTRDALVIEGDGRQLAVSVHLADYPGFIAWLRRLVPDARLDFDPTLAPWALRDASAPPARPWPLFAWLIAALAGLLTTLHFLPPHGPAVLLAATGGVLFTLPTVWARLASRWAALHTLRSPTWEMASLFLAIGFVGAAQGKINRLGDRVPGDYGWLLATLQPFAVAAISALLVLLALLAARRLRSAQEETR